MYLRNVYILLGTKKLVNNRAVALYQQNKSSSIKKSLPSAKAQQKYDLNNSNKKIMAFEHLFQKIQLL